MFGKPDLITQKEVIEKISKIIPIIIGEIDEEMLFF
jgi:hypothetical protein